MIYCQIVNDIVVNRALFDRSMPDGWAAPGDVWVASDEGQIGWHFDGQGFIAPASPQMPPPSVADVKAEAARRIEAILPDYKQRNVLAFGLETMMTYGADPSQWPEPLQQVNADMQAKWGAIKSIRVRSDEIEAMDPIPADFRDDSYW